MRREQLGESLGSILLPLALILGLVLILNLNVGQGGEGAGFKSPLESWLKLIVGYLAAGTEIAAAFVIGSAVVRGIGNYVRLLFSRSR
ncbi:MAG: DUF1622 domain-containing protein, partial [Nostocaceae cyanobacterium]|nr:DUF1622 domain-containing protein [Nostocaceae cyanobacterium]